MTKPRGFASFHSPKKRSQGCQQYPLGTVLSMLFENIAVPTRELVEKCIGCLQNCTLLILLPENKIKGWPYHTENLCNTLLKAIAPHSCYLYFVYLAPFLQPPTRFILLKWSVATQMDCSFRILRSELDSNLLRFVHENTQYGTHLASGDALPKLQFTMRQSIFGTFYTALFHGARK